MLALHRWAFFVPFTVVATTVFVLSLYYPRLYRATTSFERKNDPVMMNLPMSTGAASFEQYRSTMARDLTSVEYMRRVVDNLELTKDFPRDEHGELTAAGRRRRDALAGSLGTTLEVSSVSPTPQLDITTITYIGPDPDLGIKLVDEAKRVFIRLTKEWIHKYLTDQRSFWAAEAEEALTQLKLARREETTFRLENPYADPTNPGAVALRLAQREMELRDLELRKREYESELTALEEIMATLDPLPDPQTVQEGGMDAATFRLLTRPEVAPLADQLRTLRDRVDELLTTRGMTIEHPGVAKLLRRREELMGELRRLGVTDRMVTLLDAGQAAIAGVLPGRLPPVGESTGSQRVRLLVQIAAQKAKIADVELSLDATKTAIEDVQRAKRQIHAKRAQFADINGKVKMAAETYAQRREALALIDPAINAFDKNKLLLFTEGQGARGSHKPVSPKALTVVILALVAGIATGALFVILAEVFDHVYRSSTQVARSLGLPMLESIDEIVTSEDRRYLFLRRVVVSPIVIVCFVGLTGFAGSMAYLSIEQPAAYQSINRVSRAFLDLFAGSS
ncbi:MAG: GumC family protein [Phycisphaerae bacterium]